MGLLKQFLLAYKGSLLWKYEKLIHHIKRKDTTLFMIEQDDELNYYAYVYANKFQQKKCSKNLMVISPYSDVLNIIPEGVEITKKIYISPKTCNAIKKYYQLVNFSDYVRFISLSWPENNWVYRLIGKNNVNKEEIVCLGLYVLRSLPERKVDKYAV